MMPPRLLKRCVGMTLLLLAPVNLSHADPDTKAAPAPAAGLRAELLSQLDAAGRKLVELAQAMPPSKYTWKPGNGVRSTAEVYLHVAATNYLLPQLMGVAPPAGIEIRKLEQSTTDKSRVLQILEDSFAHARNAIGAVPDADLDKPVKLFDHEGTTREAMLLLVVHAHEHLGQSIAYARVNHVVPPWTARQAAPPPAKP